MALNDSTTSTMATTLPLSPARATNAGSPWSPKYLWQGEGAASPLSAQGGITPRTDARSPWNGSPLPQPQWCAARSPRSGNTVGAVGPAKAPAPAKARRPPRKEGNSSNCCSSGLFALFLGGPSKDEKYLIGQWQVHQIRPSAGKGVFHDSHWTPRLYYTITKSDGTPGLSFSADDFRGTLYQKRGGWYEAALTDKFGSPFGVIRLRREAGGILTNFKADKNSPDWGSDHLAIRIGEDVTRDACARPGSKPYDTATNGFLSQRDKDVLTSEKVRQGGAEKSPARCDRTRSASPTPRSASPRRSPGKEAGSCCLPGKTLRGSSPASPRSTKPGEPLLLYLPKELNGMQVLTRMAGVNRWQAHDTFLRSETDGIFYRWSKDLNDRHPLMTVRFGDTIEGSDEFDGWIKCKVMAVEERDRFLPLSVRGHAVLQQLSQKTWQLVNNSLQDATDGLGYRNSKHLSDVDTTCLGPRWGDVITGSDCGDGWVRCEFDSDRISDAASDRILNTSTKTTDWINGPAGKLVATPSTGCSSPACMGALTPTRTPTPTSIRSTTPVLASWPTSAGGGGFNSPPRTLPPQGGPPWTMTPPRSLLPGSPIRAGAASPLYRGAATPPRHMVPTYPAGGAQTGMAAWAWPQSPAAAYASPAGSYAGSGYPAGLYTKSRFEYDDGRT